ncbi:efflux RND transporter periplasmic adaptor subunit [Patescibacteria group bacterium]|nr:efflux RND transporter periplasmic adaptor subunit [Patescibacteria group bacterium]
MKARYIIIPVVIVGAIALTAWLLGRAFHESPQYELYEVRQGSVAKTVSVSGSVVSDQKFELGFLSPGIVQTVNVEVGSTVKQGDLLVTLDTSVLREQANQARASVSVASAMLSKSRNALRPQDVTVLNRSLDSARVTLNTAQKNLQDAYRARDLDINNSAASLAGAEMAYQNAVNTYNARQSVIDQSTISAQVALNNASNALSIAQSSYNQILNLYNSGQASMLDLQQAQSALSTANSSYLTARSAYDNTMQQANLERVSASASVDSARVQLDSARAMYNSSLSGIDAKINSAQNALSSAQAAYNLANAQYQQSLAPAHPADVASASAQMASASASLRAIQAQIDKAYIKAPIEGIITAVNATEHEISPMSAPAVVLETIGVYQIEAYISEVDIEKIAPGSETRITLDALPNIEIHGSVAQIDPAATVVLGVVNYKINVAITDEVEQLKPAMTADLEILTEQQDNVLFVPRKAVTRSDGKYLVKVLVNDQAEEREVQVGLVGDNELEILTGLTEGDRIVLKEL